MKKHLQWSVIYFIFIASFTSKAQSTERFTINGYVREKGSGELLPGVSVYVKNKKIGMQTNNYGFYSLTLNTSEEITIVYSFVGYRSESKTLKIPKKLEMNIELTPDFQELKEVTVRANSPEQQKISENVQMSQVSVPIQQIKEIPALLGEKDVLKVLQLMPGVQKGSEGNSGIYVRGGGADQNLLILDDAPVYNASHLFGFFSVFNGDALKSVELTKGGFPARFGGRLSSVIEMQMKEGNREKLHVEGGIGLISSRLLVESPIGKNKKSSFLISGRRTYIDALVRPFINKDDGDGGYYFYDLNAKVNYDFGQNNKLYLSGYFGKDVFFGIDKQTDGTQNEFGLDWGNQTATLRWNHLYNERLFMNSSFIFSNYQFKIYAIDQSIQQNKKVEYELSYLSNIRDVGFKTDFDYLPNPQHSIKFGFSGTFHQFSPSSIVVKDDAIGKYQNNVESIEATESGVYAEDTYKPFDKLKINAGIRLSSFATNKVKYLNPEPRVAMAYSVRNNLAFKASFATMNQYIHLLSNSGASLPTDLWVPSTDKLPAQRSRQFAMGMAKDFNEKNLALTVEGYYKEMDNIVAYKEGSSSLLQDGPEELAKDKEQGKSWDDQVTSGKGRSYGAEILLQRKVGKLTGWIGYTLSWTKHQFDELNFGKEFWAKNDRRHDLSVVGIYHLSPRTTLSGTWIYGTGNALTVPTAAYTANVHNPGVSPFGIPGSTGYTYNYFREYPDYGERNNFRAEAYHRLDIGVQFHKIMKKGHERVWEFSIYNLYNRKNPYFYSFSNTYNNATQATTRNLTRYSLLGIIPSLSYSFKF
ncbi:TonB-dependent receptor [Arcicella sp. LKC2W]|uniref:TonB-dependent receptor n=1 Tax=Arcicella sp. LKC2W TaxID=2984198 RepID=UPI002B1F791B|nr:TonB-dependent receptor [Arcicella sp. LKC2W]MEA5457952.1 TonB-dependent receptor [Arcicella sp. LKC2W]